jgi:hypothetical protein
VNVTSGKRSFDEQMANLTRMIDDAEGKLEPGDYYGHNELYRLRVTLKERLVGHSSWLGFPVGFVAWIALQFGLIFTFKGLPSFPWVGIAMVSSLAGAWFIGRAVNAAMLRPLILRYQPWLPKPKKPEPKDNRIRFPFDAGETGAVVAVIVVPGLLLMAGNGLLSDPLAWVQFFGFGGGMIAFWAGNQHEGRARTILFWVAGILLAIGFVASTMSPEVPYS